MLQADRLGASHDGEKESHSSALGKYRRGSLAGSEGVQEAEFV